MFALLSSLPCSADGIRGCWEWSRRGYQPCPTKEHQARPSSHPFSSLSPRPWTFPPPPLASVSYLLYLDTTFTPVDDRATGPCCWSPSGASLSFSSPPLPTANNVLLVRRCFLALLLKQSPTTASLTTFTALALKTILPLLPVAKKTVTETERVTTGSRGGCTSLERR
jgi:hypothetical protein